MKTPKLQGIFTSLLIVLILCTSWISKTETYNENRNPAKKTIYVYPVHISKITREESFDTIIAKRIVDFINEKGDYRAVFINSKPAVNAEWYMNEAKMLNRSCEAFTGFLKTNAQPDGYGLLVEFLWLPYEIDVHFSLVDKNTGKAVLKGLANSHHPAHKEIKPQNNDGAFRLFCKIFAEDLNH
jgi:hypothetical protein